MTVVTTGCIYGGSKMNDRAKAYWTECDKTEECELYKNGKCACFRFLLGPSIVCPNAEARFSTGPTRRAKSYDDFKSRFREKFENNVSEFKDKLSIVPGYVFLPMAYLAGAENELSEDVIKGHFIRVELFDEDFIQKAVLFRPRPWFGTGVIEKYGKEEVPKFIQQLSEEMPKLYAKWAEKYPETAEKFADISPVGRTAYIATLPDGCRIKTSNGYFVKNGEFLTCEDYRSAFLPFRAKTSICSIKIGPEMTAPVTPEMIVNKETRYID